MIIVFGALYMDYHYDVEAMPEAGKQAIATSMMTEPGGRAVCQAYAAVRCGGRAAIVGMVGEDVYGKRILDSIRGDGVITSGVGHFSDLPTGQRVYFHKSGSKDAVVKVKGANVETAADQIPDEILLPKNLVLMQMDLSPEQNWEVLRHAKAGGAVTMLNLAPVIKIPHESLKLLDYLVVNKVEAKQMADTMGINVEDDALKLAKALSQLGDLTCVVTLSSAGAVACEKGGKCFKVGALKLVDDEGHSTEVDVTGAGDAFCGTLATSIQQNMALPVALKRACVAASLVCTKRGGISSYPYQDEVEKAMDKVDDAVEVQ